MLFEMPECGACRTCEIACCFHHIGEFSQVVSSIRILEKPDRLGFCISLFEKDENANRACDGCPGLDEPLCMEVCKEKEKLREMIETVIRQSVPVHGNDESRGQEDR